MAATYTMRDCSEFQEVLQRIAEKDLLRKAGILSRYEDPDRIFRNHRIERDHAFGTLVLFESRPSMDKQMPDAGRCANLEEIEELIGKLNQYPSLTAEEYALRRREYLDALKQYEEINHMASDSAKELHRLEAAVKNAGKQQEWLEKENAARIRRIHDMEREIRDYETALKERSSLKEGNTGKLKAVLEQSSPLVQNLEQDRERLHEVTRRLMVIKDEQTVKNRLLHPTATRLKALEAERLGMERSTLQLRIQTKTSELKGLEKTISDLEQQNIDHEAEDARLQSLLEQCRNRLKSAEKELESGSRMVRNLSERSQVLAARIAALGTSDLCTIEEREKSYASLLEKSEAFLHAWIGASSELKSILAVDGISARELVEAIFFACGPLCASGTTACIYLDSANAQLENLLLYRTDEERAGFWHVESFD